MMIELRVCFEVNGLAEDEDGNPCSAGLQMTIGNAQKEIDYDKLTQNIDIEKVIEYAGLAGIVKPEDVKVITPEEYDRLYGWEDGENDG